MKFIITTDFVALMETASFYGGPEASGRHERYSVQQEIASKNSQ
jgi:hypothetical protein